MFNTIFGSFARLTKLGTMRRNRPALEPLTRNEPLEPTSNLPELASEAAGNLAGTSPEPVRNPSRNLPPKPCFGWRPQSSRCWGKTVVVEFSVWVLVA